MTKRIDPMLTCNDRLQVLGKVTDAIWESQTKCDDVEEHASAALAAIEAAGYRVVPVEPTDHMETAGILAQDESAGENNIARPDFRAALRAAIAAAPKVTE